jgi:hypothetical protein
MIFILVIHLLILIFHAFYIDNSVSISSLNWIFIRDCSGNVDVLGVLIEFACGSLIADLFETVILTIYLVFPIGRFPV